MKDILVSIESSENCKSSIQAAMELAQTYDSHITCLYEEGFFGYSSYADVHADLVAGQFKEKLENEKKLVRQVYDDCVSVRAHKCNLIFEKPDTSRNAVSYANSSDIIVCNQRNVGNAVFQTRNQATHLVMATGKPVLIIPYIGMQETLGKNIVVAWDSSREASRALHDSLPLLKRAQQVHIFSAIDDKSMSNKLTATNIKTHLEHHDVNVENNPVVIDDISVAEMLLSRASDYGADLIVMGAYGHSRLREYTFGGTTKTMFDSMTIPVLMTH